jgi:uncharacterized protein YegL
VSLVAPGWLLLCAFGVLVLLLHLRRRRTLEIPSIQLWQQLETRRTSRSRDQRPPFNFLLLLQLLVLTLCALALAQPLIGSAPRFAHEIVVLDASGSMRSTDVAPSRFDAAVADLIGLSAGALKESGARTSVILAGAHSRFIAARLSDSAGLATQFERLRAGDGLADWAEVARLAWSVIKDGEPTRLTLITDGADGSAARLSAALPGLAVEARTIAGAGARTATLRAALRALDPGSGKWRVEGRVAFPPGSSGATTVTAFVQPEGSSGFLEWGAVEVRADLTRTPREASFVIDLELPRGGAVVLQLPRDAGQHDVTAQFVVRPNPRVLKILQIGDVSEPLTRALRAATDVELYAATSPPSDTSTFDLVVANGMVLERRPGTNVLWLGSARPATEPMGRVVPGISPTGWADDHPLTDRVSWNSVQPGRTYQFAPRRGADLLLEANGMPLIEAHTMPGGRDVRIAFDIDGSGWTEQTSFPIFVSNLLRWIAPDLGRTVDKTCTVGVSCALDPRLVGGDGSVVTVRTNDIGDETARRLPSVGPIYDDQFIPDRSGLYRFERNGLTRLVAVNLPADRENPTDVPPKVSTSRMSSQPPVRSWLLAAMFVILAVEGWFAGRAAERFLRAGSLRSENPLARRRRLLLAARVTTLLLVAAALTGVPIVFPDRGANLVVVAAPNLKGERETRQLMGPIETLSDRTNGLESRPGRVAIDARSRVIADLGDAVDNKYLTSGAALPAGANLEDALDLAAAMLPGGAPGRIVVASDGSQTRGDAVRALPALLARGLTVDVMAIPVLEAGEVLVERVSAPEQVYAGDSFRLRALVYSQGPSTATLRIFKDGDMITERPLELPGGRSWIETDIRKVAAGRARYEVAVDAPGDVFPQNNRNGITLDIALAQDVLIVAAQPAWADVLAKALALQDIKTKVVEPKRAPFYLKDWLAYSGIVLMNVPAIDLSTLQQELIEKAVADHGRGLLLLGGENSFGPGGYYETPLERVSPLSSRVPRDAPKVALGFVLDRSGSMQRNEGGVTRLDIAKQATLSAIRLLHEDSLISIVVFDSEAKVLLPLRTAKDTSAVAEALARLEPGGGTAIYPGLVEALHQLEGVDAMAKHIVVMSDGLSQPGDFPGILKAISDQSISVSAVAIGEGADGTRLEEIARGGKGAFHSTNDFKALPSILSQEALLLSGKPVEERSVLPVWSDRNPEFFAGLPEFMPPVHGYVLTSRKSGADAHLVVSDAKQEPVPLLASWRYGNGRVVALTTQGAGAWSRDWQSMPEYPLLWAQTLRHVLPAPRAGGLSARAVRHGDEVAIVVDASNPDGTPRAGREVTASLTREGSPPTEVALTETSPGHHFGHATLQGTGDFVLRAVANPTTAEVPLHVAYPALYAFPHADFERLAALAATTGGRVIADPEQILASGQRRWITQDGWKIWVLSALALFLIDLIIRYASSLRGSGKARGSE